MPNPGDNVCGELEGVEALSFFNVVFNDGDHDIPLPSSVIVLSNTDFKKFKEVISKKIGVEPHQIATFLIRRRKGRLSPGRKVPIDESTDFNALVRNPQDCHILAVLRKSPRRDRRPRRGIPLPRMPDSSPELWEQQILYRMRQLEIQEQELKLREQELHMQMQMDQQHMMGNYPYPVPVARPRYAEVVGEARQRYAAVVGEALPARPGAAVVGEVIPARPAAVQVCRECQEVWETGRRSEFHPCNLDPVVENLRPTAGPIQRPR